MLYPKEEKENKTSYLFVSKSRVQRYLIELLHLSKHNSTEDINEMTNIITEVIADPTPPRTSEDLNAVTTTQSSFSLSPVLQIICFCFTSVVKSDVVLTGVNDNHVCHLESIFFYQMFISNVKKKEKTTSRCYFSDYNHS